MRVIIFRVIDAGLPPKAWHLPGDACGWQQCESAASRQPACYRLFPPAAAAAAAAGGLLLSEGRMRWGMRKRV